MAGEFEIYRDNSRQPNRHGRCHGNDSPALHLPAATPTPPRRDTAQSPPWPPFGLRPLPFPFSPRCFGGGVSTGTGVVGGRGSTEVVTGGGTEVLVLAG